MPLNQDPSCAKQIHVRDVFASIFPKNLQRQAHPGIWHLTHTWHDRAISIKREGLAVSVASRSLFRAFKLRRYVFASKVMLFLSLWLQKICVRLVQPFHTLRECHGTPNIRKVNQGLVCFCLDCGHSRLHVCTTKVNLKHPNICKSTINACPNMLEFGSMVVFGCHARESAGGQASCRLNILNAHRFYQWSHYQAVFTLRLFNFNNGNHIRTVARAHNGQL
jgi:hypothetical protein